MKINSVRIQNFRCFADETIRLGDYTCLVGPNGAGKSSVLGALNVVFRNSDSPFEVSYLAAEDFHHKNTADPVKITVTFTDLSDQAKEDLKAYVRHDSLVLSAVADWSQERERAEVRQVGSRLVMKPFVSFFEALEQGAKVVALKTIYSKFRGALEDLPDAKTKDAMRLALREYEEQHEDQCELIESGDQFYGWSRGSNVLERHFQWVYVPAVKNPAEEQDETKNSALGKLLHRTIRSRVDFSESVSALRSATAEKYRALLAAENSVLDEVGEALTKRLREWAHPATQVKLIWNYDDQKSVRVEEPMARVKVGEGSFFGDLIRLGHGVQRSFLVVLLQELIETEDENAPTLVLAIEEPELYQHPPQIRHFAAVLEDHARKGAQVLLTTHSPYFVSGRGFESVRMTRKHHEADETRITQLTHAELSIIIAEALGAEPISPSSTMAAIEQILQPSQSELFFSSVPVFVEGPEDVAYISTQLRLLDRWGEFRRYGCHFVTCSGKNAMSRPVAIAKGLLLPFYCIFDGDSDRCKDDQTRAEHERDNGCLLRLCDHDTASIPASTEWGWNSVMWQHNIGRAVIGDLGEEQWNAAEANARNKHGLVDGVKRKNPLLIAATLELLHEDQTSSAILTELCKRLLDYASSMQGGSASPSA